MEFIQQTVTQQLDLAQNNSLAEMQELETSTGVLDRVAADAITVMLEHNNDLKGKGKGPGASHRCEANIPQKMQALCDDMESTGRTCNPLLELYGMSYNVSSVLYHSLYVLKNYVALTSPKISPLASCMHLCLVQPSI